MLYQLSYRGTLPSVEREVPIAKSSRSAKAKAQIFAANRLIAETPAEQRDRHHIGDL
jgi:hypothetical protein